MESTHVKRQTVIEGLVFVSLVILGALLRIRFQHVPNFAPVAALALFSGYFFRSWMVALAVPLSVMALSDWQLGGYDWRMMVLVYGMLAAPVAARSWLRRAASFQQGAWGGAVRSLTGLVGCSLAASILFFVVTNLGVWLWFPTYAHSWTGLAECYLYAVPFFRFTVAGDLFFACVLFGGYAAAVQCGWARQAAMAVTEN